MNKSLLTTSLIVLFSLAILLSGFSVDSHAAAKSKSYIITANSNSLPSNLEAQVKALNGSLTSKMSKIGLAVAKSSSSTFARDAAKINGIKSVTLDQRVQWIDPDMRVKNISVGDLSIGDDETFFEDQWALLAIHAPEAWDAGARGAGVRVAILDGGIASNHIDLDDNIDLAASKSFVPGTDFNQDEGIFWHGSHVAGIVAAEDNGIGTIGVAPNATIIAVKVLHDGSGYFSWLIEGILYAADEANADIINMSLGAVFPRNNWDAAQLNSALGRAINFAYQKGVTVIASAGNEGADFDHVAYWISVPAELQHVIAVSATGPVGGENFDRPASYTNYGQSIIDFAAPGGDFVLYPNNGWWLDMVLSPTTVVSETSYRYSWAAGTSQAAPHVAGVAALIIEKNGGSMHPAQVEAALRKSADDLGKPGNDDYYGKGRVNAFKAVGGSLSKQLPEIASVPETFSLSKNYPNPFNPTTSIDFALPTESHVTLQIYNIQGQLVKTLQNGMKSAGNHSLIWNATNEAGISVPSGTYFYKINAGEYQATHKMILLK